MLLASSSSSSSSHAIAPTQSVDRLSTRQATIHWRLQVVASSLTCTALPSQYGVHHTSRGRGSNQS